MDAMSDHEFDESVVKPLQNLWPSRFANPGDEVLLHWRDQLARYPADQVRKAIWALADEYNSRGSRMIPTASGVARRVSEAMGHQDGPRDDVTWLDTQRRVWARDDPQHADQILAMTDGEVMTEMAKHCEGRGYTLMADGHTTALPNEEK